MSKNESECEMNFQGAAMTKHTAWLGELVARIDWRDTSLYYRSDTPPRVPLEHFEPSRNLNTGHWGVYTKAGKGGSYFVARAESESDATIKAHLCQKIANAVAAALATQPDTPAEEADEVILKTTRAGYDRLMRANPDDLCGVDAVSRELIDSGEMTAEGVTP